MTSSSISSTLRGLVDLLVFDFDGVLTDNRVIVSEDGTESVVCNRADGLGFDMLRAARIPVLILSTERNRVVGARAAKIKAPVLQAVGDKAKALSDYCAARGIDLQRVAFVGNDLNDVAAMRLVGHSVAVADAHPAARAAARTVLATAGGGGVAREIAERLLALPYGEAMSAAVHRSAAHPSGNGVLALIPARGGSKSVPRKNLLEIGGKPLIAYTIAHALGARRIDRVIVSTDDEEIAEVARRYGAEVPFLRPAEISGDHALDVEFHRHAIEWLAREEGYRPDMIVNLRPPHPVRRCETIDRAIEVFAQAHHADSLRSVRLAEVTAFKMWTISEDGLLVPAATLPGAREPYNLPRQSLPPVYWQDGYIDITRPSVVIEKNSTTGDVIIPFIIEEECVDIDYADEIPEAERLIARTEASAPPAGPRGMRHPS